jgi:hypothetical protein
VYQNGHKIYQTAVKFSKNTNIFHSKALPNLPKFGFGVWKHTIWQPCNGVDAST